MSVTRNISQSERVSRLWPILRDGGEAAVTIHKKIALNDQKCHSVLEMISLSRRARIRGKIHGKFRHRVFTAVRFLWLVNSSERNTKTGAADVDRKMLREYCS